ncbi:MAG: hypothetical protein CL579_02640 [Alteromonadaceae bacterium]|jgi:hypothetical protein|uniref:Uncharacterized protein n=1 Tax=Paraglaciecola mesophila TaxID=197222 RepID=A0ABU9SSS7_9ALTE|nr:hypothetical protein [Alteromonadaceae bacterium]|tara:strand:- start:3871 stop:4092 length:222 start_codon:yes stop_codon:yes gene_type:complete
MTDYNDQSNLQQRPALATQAIKTAIANGDEVRLKALLTNEVFDELEKNHFVELAKESGNTNIVKLLEDTPATP